MVVAGLPVLWLTLLVLFHQTPQIDLAVSRWFHDAADCALTERYCIEFPLASDRLVGAIREVLHYLPGLVALLLLMSVGVDFFEERNFSFGRTRLKCAVIAAFVLGPGLLVNGVLKNFSGRPRPRDVDLFGGHLPFASAGEWTQHCLANCSFVSGEAAGGFLLIGLAPLFPPDQRLRAAVALSAVAFATAGMRVAFGAHFLSDALLGGLSTLMVFALLAVLVEYWNGRIRR